MAALKWYDFKSSRGTITIKAENEEAAREEASERWNISEDEIVCTGHQPYYSGRRLWT